MLIQNTQIKYEYLVCLFKKILGEKTEVDNKMASHLHPHYPWLSLCDENVKGNLPNYNYELSYLINCLLHTHRPHN